MCPSFHFGTEGRIWDVIVLIPDHCLFISADSDVFSSLFVCCTIYYSHGQHILVLVLEISCHQIQVLIETCLYEYFRADLHHSGIHMRHNMQMMC